MEMMRSEVMSMAKNLLIPVMQQQSSNMAGFGEQMVTAMSTMRGHQKAEKEGKPEEPKLINVADFVDEKDDATTCFAHGIKNAIRPFGCPPKDYWGGVSRYSCYIHLDLYVM